MGKGPQKREANGSIIPNIWKNKKCSKPPINNGIVKHQTWRIWTQSEHKEMWAKKSYRPGCCTMLHHVAPKMFETLYHCCFGILYSQGITGNQPTSISISAEHRARSTMKKTPPCFLQMHAMAGGLLSLQRFVILFYIATLRYPAKKKVSWLQWG